jgi:hypothetical protein
LKWKQGKGTQIESGQWAAEMGYESGKRKGDRKWKGTWDMEN